MPVISEKREGRRRGARAWLIGCGALFGLPLLLVLLPLATPVALHVGNRWLRVHTDWVSFGPDRDPLSWGAKDDGSAFIYNRSDGPQGLPSKMEAQLARSEPRWIVDRRGVWVSLWIEDHHVRWVSFRPLTYWIEWYRLGPQ